MSAPIRPGTRNNTPTHRGEGGQFGQARVSVSFGPHRLHSPLTLPKPNTTPTPIHIPQIHTTATNFPIFFLLFFLFFFFQAGRTPVLVSLCFGASFSVRLAKIKAQAAARVGRSGISEGCFTAPKERDWTYPPAA